MKPKSVLLVNSRSRAATQSFETAKATLLKENLNLAETKAFRTPRDLFREIRNQVDQETPLIIVGGGDGTLGTAASIIARSKSVMGVLPLGTGNAFARDLGIPTLPEACAAILENRVVQVDMGMVENRTFLNVATCGLSTLIARGLDSEAKKLLGKAAYAASILRALTRVKPFHVELELPSGTYEFDSLQVVIGNGRFHAGPFPITPDASITAGWLSIYALATTQKSHFLRMALRLPSGKHVELDDVRSYQATSGRLVTTPTRQMTIDGEIGMQTPVEFKSMPRSLSVVVSSSFVVDDDTAELKQGSSVVPR